MNILLLLLGLFLNSGSVTNVNPNTEYTPTTNEVNDGGNVRGGRNGDADFIIGDDKAMM